MAATTDRLSPSSLESISLSDSDLRTISGNSEDLIIYTKQLAGVYSGSDHLYVDGLPADHPPPADRIGAITINADPFSAEYSDGGDAHIDIATKKTERKFSITSLGASLGNNAPNGLNPSLGSTSKTANLGVTGPVPYTPLAFTANALYTDNHVEQPIEADVPLLQGISITSAISATTTGQNAAFGFAVDYSQRENLHVGASRVFGRRA